MILDATPAHRVATATSRAQRRVLAATKARELELDYALACLFVRHDEGLVRVAQHLGVDSIDMRAAVPVRREYFAQGTTRQVK